MKLILGDSLHKLRDLPTGTIDAVVTDPPYGLAFMNKHWDYDVPSVELWREVYRVLKPGGHMLSFFGTRTYHRGVDRIEDAGFEIRDMLSWIYGSGFPKSHNLSGDWKGWGTALKPANEPVVLARKPLEPKLTVAANVLKHGTGAINVDASRIAGGERPHIESKAEKSLNAFGNGLNGSKSLGTFTQGRWPSNLLFDEEAAAVLDGQSGVTKSGGTGGGGKTFHGAAYAKPEVKMQPNSGGASRFFYVAKASKRERNAGLEGMPEKETHRLGSGVGRTDGANSDNTRPAYDKNHHPTVKPIKLMEYLVRMITPPGGIVLDPFMGSGTTGCAAVKLGFQFIGIEREAEYLEIARKRIEFHAKHLSEPADSDDTDQVEFDLGGL